jgi:hypothetical protein
MRQTLLALPEVPLHITGFLTLACRASRRASASNLSRQSQTPLPEIARSDIVPWEAKLILSDV